LLYIMDTNSRTCGRKERVGHFLKDRKHFFSVFVAPNHLHIFREG
jgi:hypothetical protein